MQKGIFLFGLEPSLRRQLLEGRIIKEFPSLQPSSPIPHVYGGRAQWFFLAALILVQDISGPAIVFLSRDAEILCLCSDNTTDKKAEDQAQKGGSSGVFDFGGEAAPKAIIMRGLCKAADDSGLQACQWTAEENSSRNAVPKYFIEF